MYVRESGRVDSSLCVIAGVGDVYVGGSVAHYVESLCMVDKKDKVQLLGRYIIL